MRIIFILDNLFPNGKASTARVRSYGKGFVSNGVKVKVILPVPRQKHSAKHINPKAKGIDDNGVEYVHTVGTCMRNRYALVRKLQDVYGYTLTLLSILFKTHKDDFYIIYEGSPLWHRLCVATVHMVGAKVGIELNELPFGTGRETAATIHKRKVMLARVFPRLDFILAISEPLAILGRKYAPQAKVVKVPIIAEGHLEGEDFKEPHVPYLFHSGSLFEQKDGICGMIEAFGIACQHLKQPLEYVLTGELCQSPHAKEIEAIIKKYNIEDRVKFVGYLDMSTLHRYQKNCLLTIINKYDTQQNKYCFSTKLSEYLSFSRPVITTTIGEANYYLKNGVNAFIVEPHSPKQIAEKIVYIYEHPAEARRIGEEAHKLVEKEFDCSYQTARIIKVLNQMNDKK